MKKLLVAITILACVSAQAQTADEIITKYTNAAGGLDNFNKVKSVKMTGTVSTQGVELPITIQIINGKAMRTDLELMGQSVTNAYKDGKGWKINPFAGATTPTDVTGEELSEFKSQSSIANNLMDYKARGHSVEYLGEETIEGVKTYKIKLITKDDKKESIHNIVQSDFSLLRSVTKRDMMGSEVDVETYFSNYKEFAGLKLALNREQKIDGQVFQSIALNTVEPNVTIDEKIFDKP